MSAIAISFKQDPRLNDGLGDLSGVMLRALTMRVETEAKRRAPVKTGNLRRSITSAIAEVEGVPLGVVAATAHYAGFVELGTRYTNPQPFLRPALVSVLR